MIKVVSNSEMRNLDEFTIHEVKIPGLVLMENAGLKSAQIIQKHIESNNLNGTIYVYCGKGNNGGDGYVIARQLFDEGYKVVIYSVGDPKSLKGDALVNYISCKNLNVPILVINAKKEIKKLKSPMLIVDALLGTGIKGPVSGFYDHHGSTQKSTYILPCERTCWEITYCKDWYPKLKDPKFKATA